MTLGIPSVIAERIPHLRNFSLLLASSRDDAIRCNRHVQSIVGEGDADLVSFVRIASFKFKNAVVWPKPFEVFVPSTVWRGGGIAFAGRDCQVNHFESVFLKRLPGFGDGQRLCKVRWLGAEPVRESPADVVIRWRSCKLARQAN